MTASIELTKDWLNLTADQSLVNGSVYTVQNFGSYQIFLNESDSLPLNTDEGIVLNQYDSVLILQKDDNIYIRSSGSVSKVVITNSDNNVNQNNTDNTGEISNMHSSTINIDSTGSISSNILQNALNELGSRYYIHSYYSRQLDSQINITPTNNTIIVNDISLTVPDVLIGDILEINTTIMCDYIAYNDIGDTFKIYINIDGDRFPSIPIGNITGGDNNLETGYGNLYTPYLVTKAGTATIEVEIKTKSTRERVFIIGSSGILAKIVRNQ